MIPFVANALWFASCVPEAWAFRRATRQVAATQRRVLLDILRRSREYADIRSVAEFQERVPLSNEPVVTNETVIRRIPTSGTTAPTKWIPYTASLDQEFRRGIAPWIVDLFQHNPGMLRGKSYWAISPVGEAGTGFGDDTEYLGPARCWVKSTLAVPPSVRHITDMDEWRRETLRHLTACRDLTFISVWNPTFLMLLVEPLRREELVGLWPNLRVISCWADVAAAQPAAELARLFPQATIQPKGLIATEGFVSLPLWEHDGAALAVRSHFFEFLDDAGAAKLAHELVAGKEYVVVLTTGGGLHRYRLQDRVRVTGFEQECPLLRFVGRETLVSDHFGEKVNERHVREALDAIGVDTSFALVACEDDAYTLFMETTADDAQLLVAAEQLETALQKNVHYRYCRQLGQLQAARIFRVSHDGRSAWLMECVRRGQRLGEIKPLVLSRHDGWARVFSGRHLNRTESASSPRMHAAQTVKGTDGP